MKREPDLPLDRIRARSGELPNHLIDELTAGRLDRREFLRRASVAGLSASAAGVILAACGGANSSSPAKSSSAASGPAKAGGSLRVAQQVPAAAVNPLTVADAGTDYAKWPTTFIGTGAFKLSSFSQATSASFVPNPDYWGPKPLLAKTTFNFYASQQPQVLAMEGGDADLIAGFVPQGAEALLTGKYTIISRKSSGHREISMRCDKPPFTDARVRRAVALTLNRPALISSLLSGHGTLGNDSPFAQRFPSTDTSIPQRKQDIAQAKQLLAAAGHPNGFSATYVSEQALEMPALAQLVQADAYVAAVDLQTQRKLAGQIEQLLLDQTPVIIPYFLTSLTANTTNVRGVNPSSIGAMWLGKASIA